MAKGDLFLKLDKIKGESADHKHKDEIDIESFSWGLSNAGAHGGGGGGGAGKVSVHDISISKNLDASSPKLNLFCAGGTHIAEGTITVRKAGDKPLEYLKIKLTDILISGVQYGAHGGTTITENLTLNFAKYEFAYTPQKADGSGGATDAIIWNVKENKKG